MSSEISQSEDKYYMISQIHVESEKQKSRLVGTECRLVAKQEVKRICWGNGKCTQIHTHSEVNVVWM